MSPYAVTGGAGKILLTPSGGDDYPELQEAINGYTLVELSNGVFQVSQPLLVTSPTLNIVGQGWNQTTTTSGTVLKATGAMSDVINVATAGERFRLSNVAIDAGGLATNGVTIDALNCQISESYVRRPANNGAGFNVTTNGTSVWLTNCRFNGANQAGCVGFLINGTDSTSQGCKAVNCLDGFQYLSGASGAIHTAGHHTPGSTIGRCCIFLNGNPSNVQIVGTRIDNHALGSGIQISPTANIAGVTIKGCLWFQNVITDATFAAIGVDTSTANVRQLVIVGNVIRSAASHNYTAMLTAQVLAGTGATNPTRIATAGTIANSNVIHAAAAFGASSTPLVARGNVLSTDGATFAAVTDT